MFFTGQGALVVKGENRLVRFYRVTLCDMQDKTYQRVHDIVDVVPSRTVGSCYVRHVHGVHRLNKARGGREHGCLICRASHDFHGR